MIGLLVSSMIGAATPAARQIDVTDFRAVMLATDATLRIEQAPVATVMVKGDPNLVRCVTASVRDRRLVIGWERNGAAADTIHPASNDIVVTARMRCPRKSDAAKITILVAGPSIEGVTLSAAGNVRVAPMSVRAFAAEIPALGTIDIEDLRTPSSTFSIPGRGLITAAGRFGRMTVAISGSGTVDLRAGRANQVDVMLGGHGVIMASVDGPATGSLSGNGKIVIAGHPSCAIATLGRGRVVCPAP